jgi:spore coat protein U-like protein
MLTRANVRTFSLALAAAALSGVAGSAIAGQTAPAIMTVTATVGPSCVLNTVTNVAFGTYVPGTESDANGSFTLNCTAGAPITVSISAGNGSGHSQGTDTRAMVSGANFLSYDLFQDGGHQTVWPVATSVPFTGTGAPVIVNVFGRIRSSLTGVVNGAYSDTVNIVASF